MNSKSIPLYFKLTRSHVLSELNAFKEYISLTQASLNKAQEDFEADFSSDSYESDEDAEAYWSFESYKLTEVMPSFFRNSTFTSVYDFLGNKLVSLCWYLHKAGRYKIKPTDINGETDLEKSKRYLNLVAGINLDASNTEWSKIKDYQKIRKCIVHYGGSIMFEPDKPLEKQLLFPLISKFPNIQLKSNGFIIISNNQFLIDFINLTGNYLQSVFNAIEDQFQFQQ